VYNVIRSLPYVMANVMKQGRVVKFDGIGSFRYTISSNGKGVTTEAEVSASQITDIHVRFTPEAHRPKGLPSTRALVTDSISFSRWKEDAKRTDQGGDDNTGGGNTPGTGGDDEPNNYG
jgi:predicted histone-like DNA-binding protein